MKHSDTLEVNMPWLTRGVLGSTLFELIGMALELVPTLQTSYRRLIASTMGDLERRHSKCMVWIEVIIFFVVAAYPPDQLYDASDRRYLKTHKHGSMKWPAVRAQQSMLPEKAPRNSLVQQQATCFNLL